MTARIRAIAIHLPQFHPIPENDAWWGPGFTEWTNVVRARPLFPGHDQPRHPADLGYYDLRLPEARAAQAALARAEGIEGFCYYHYWFEGKRLIERPFAEMLASGEPDFPFCLCWANESWSRRWLGEERNVLQHQGHSTEDDRAHGAWLAQAFADPRWIKVASRPLFLIYRPRHLPEPRQTTDIFREETVRRGLPEPFILGVDAHCSKQDCRELGCDGTMQFEPQLSVLPEWNIDGVTPARKKRNAALGVRNPALKLYDYEEARRLMLAKKRGHETVPSICVGWDNTPRRGAEGIILMGSTPAKFEAGLAEMAEKLMPKPFDERLLFINAWNEWAEGNYLEPDERHGHGYLDAVRRVVCCSGGVPPPEVTEASPPPPSRAAETPPAPSAAGTPPLPSLRPLAFYLPQYHPIAQNDEWWGSGFTEWRNVTKATPRFPGHDQPHLPGELGLYDLRLADTRRAQADLARAHGIHGFCYYHYWFGGTRLLHEPIDRILASGEPAFPFCLCWANENWTRAWDGKLRDVLIGQNYSDEDDRAHLRWLAPVFADRRYIRIDGKPVFLLYRASQLPDARRTTDIWREEAARLGIGDLYLCRVECFRGEQTDPRALGFDASVNFQPDWAIARIPLRRSRGWTWATRLGLSPEVYQSSRVFSYPALVEGALAKAPADYLRFPCVTPMWDNSARRKEGATIFTGSTPELYERWLRETAEKFHPPSPQENLLFINAWNEWAEGNHLEPDQRRGRAYLEATKRALDPASTSAAPAR